MSESARCQVEAITQLQFDATKIYVLETESKVALDSPAFGTWKAGNPSAYNALMVPDSTRYGSISRKKPLDVFKASAHEHRQDAGMRYACHQGSEKDSLEVVNAVLAHGGRDKVRGTPYTCFLVVMDCTHVSLL